MIYLDSASTTKPKEEVIDVVNKYLKDMWTNPSSLYSPSKIVYQDVLNAKKIIGNFINADAEEIYFTSGGSESNCWALQGFVNACKYKGQKCAIITSTIEHHSILECVEHLDCDVHFVEVDNKGNINLTQLEEILESISDDINILVSIQYANNEIGTIQDIYKCVEISHKYNALFHTDATQILGQMELDVSYENIDLLTASGHKIHAPKGIGILYINNNIKDMILPLIYGTQMNNMRGGTENVPYIMGFAKAIELCINNIELNYLIVMNKRNLLLDKLKENFDIKINGELERRLPNNINITFKQNIHSEDLIYMLDMCDIYISSGSACNSYSSKPSHVLKAIGLSDEDAQKTIRLSLSEDITLEQIDIVVSEFKKQIKLLLSE